MPKPGFKILTTKQKQQNEIQKNFYDFNFIFFSLFNSNTILNKNAANA